MAGTPPTGGTVDGLWPNVLVLPVGYTIILVLLIWGDLSAPGARIAIAVLVAWLLLWSALMGAAAVLHPQSNRRRSRRVR